MVSSHAKMNGIKVNVKVKKTVVLMNDPGSSASTPVARRSLGPHQRIVASFAGRVRPGRRKNAIRDSGRRPARPQRQLGWRSDKAATAAGSAPAFRLCIRP